MASQASPCIEVYDRENNCTLSIAKRDVVRVIETSWERTANIKLGDGTLVRSTMPYKDFMARLNEQ